MDSGSTSRVDNSSDSISECFIDVTLPQELITEILVRLPVKSLLRFKCVSKPWLSLIADPQFIRSNFSKSSSMEADSLNLHVLFAVETSLKKCCLYSADPCTHVPAFEFPAENDLPIVGIINGLVCLNLKGNDLCVWNPALNRIKHLNVRRQRNNIRYVYSFGYDELNDDYKVVCLQTVAEAADAKVRIYSLKAESWRRIYRLKGFYLPFPGVFANGKIYWFAPKREFLSLDMSSEKLVQLQPLQYDNDGKKCLTRMGESGGRPFMFCNYYKENKVDLWVLDKCGVEESWCKLVSIPYTHLNFRERISMFHCRVLCIFSNGDIVFGNMNEWQVYNYKKKQSRGIEMCVGTTIWKVAAYVESLVWPDFPVSINQS